MELGLSGLAASALTGGAILLACLYMLVVLCNFPCFVVSVFVRQGFSVQCPETRFVDQAGLELTEVCLPCLPRAGPKGVYHQPVSPF